MSLDLDAVRQHLTDYLALVDAYQRRTDLTARLVAVELPAALAEIERLRAQVQAAYVYADQMGGYCSPHGVATRYAQELRAVLDNAEVAR